MGGLQQGALVTLTIFVAGLIYNAGRHSARLEAVEKALDTLRVEIRNELAELKDMLRASIGERRHWREEDK